MECCFFRWNEYYDRRATLEEIENCAEFKATGFLPLFKYSFMILLHTLM